MSAAEGVTLAGFLAARLDEDEAAAKACADNDGRLNWWDSRVMASGDHTIRTGSGFGGEGNRVVARIRRDDVEGDFGRLLDPDALASFIPRHDPARVLREVEAKRAILAAFLCAPAGVPARRRRACTATPAPGSAPTSSAPWPPSAATTRTTTRAGQHDRTKQQYIGR